MCTVLVTIKLPFYAHATGMGMGIVWVRIWPQHGYMYGRARNTATGVPGIQLRACPKYSYRCRTDTILRGVVQLRSTPLYGISH